MLRFYIKDISSDRTELRLSSNFISSSTILETYPEFIAQLAGSSYFDGFYLNFGDNKIVIAINSQLDGTEVLIKLYEALPEQFVVKSTCWVVTKVADPIAYNVSFLSEIVPLANDIILFTRS
jgi:c-di-GMP-related signal transduction protein